MSGDTPSYRTPYHDFTLDELEAYDRGVLEPARVAVIEAHLAEGCPACRRWLAGSDEAVRLVEDLARAALEDQALRRPTTRRGRLRAWGRRRMQARRLTVLLYAVPLKAALVLVAWRARPRRGTRVGVAVALVGLTVVALRYALTSPTQLREANAQDAVDPHRQRAQGQGPPRTDPAPAW